MVDLKQRKVVKASWTQGRDCGSPLQRTDYSERSEIAGQHRALISTESQRTEG